MTILTLAAWMGLLTGLVEGPWRLLCQRLGWLTTNTALFYTSVEIIWIAALLNLLLFVTLAWMLVGVARIFPRLPAIKIAVFGFGFLAFFDWMAIPGTGHIHHRGMASLAAGLGAVLMRWFGRHEAAALGFFRRTLPWVAAAALLAFLGIQGGNWFVQHRTEAGLPPAPANAPNVLVIVIDTLRADHLACYGYARETGPNIDRLAREGVLFENAVATSSHTMPTHSSVLTGRYVYEHGALQKPLDGRWPTLSEALLQRGYRTAAFSANSFFFSRRWGHGRGFIRFEDYFFSLGEMASRTLYGRKLWRFVLRPLGYEDIPARQKAEDVNRAALQWIARDTRRPFFAMLNFLDAHDPYLAPEPYRRKFSKTQDPGGRINSFMMRVYIPLTPEQLQGEKDAYDGGIAYADEKVGELLRELDRRGLLENTLVVFLSDHGESFGEHQKFLHGEGVYRPEIHVPLILHWPGHLPAGVRVKPPVSQTQIAATVMELLGDAHPLFPGPSLKQLWETPSAPADESPILSEQYASGYFRSLVSSQWHYLIKPNNALELYDWVKDPEELNNLAKTPQGQAVVEDFDRYLKAHFSKPREVQAGSPSVAAK